MLGWLKSAHLDTIKFTTASGLPIQIPDDHIYDIETVYSNMAESKFYRLDPNTSRLFFSPTGRNLKAGQAYFADYYVFFPTLAYGITDFLSLSAGMSLFPGADEQLFYVAPKLTIPISSSLSAGAGFIHIGLPEEDGISMPFAVATAGTQTYSFTAGVGIPVSDNIEGSILLLGGEVQTSNHTKLITENWIFLDIENISIFSGGIRFFSDKMAVDLALLTTTEAFEGGGFPFIPWVDFSVFFGRK